MKKISFLVAALISALCSCAQHINQALVPAIIVNAFQQQFPKATDVEWEKKGNDYEVEFETGIKEKEHHVMMDASGKILSHKQDLTKMELPAAVTNALAIQFPEFKVDEVEKNEANGVVTYHMEVEKKREEWKVIFSEDGNLLEKTAD